MTELACRYGFIRYTVALLEYNIYVDTGFICRPPRAVRGSSSTAGGVSRLFTLVV